MSIKRQIWTVVVIKNNTLYESASFSDENKAKEEFFKSIIDNGGEFLTPITEKDKECALDCCFFDFGTSTDEYSICLGFS